MTRHPLRKPAWPTLALALAFASVPPSALAGACPACTPSGLEAHEWGTFTTVSASSGRALAGLFVDASRLPAFVHGLPYFNYDPVKGWAGMDRLRNVTVKMETPVLYFYAQKETPVQVNVKFRGGTISQWYPHCSDCEANPSAASVDFGKEPYAGHIGWKATVLAPNDTPAYTSAALGGETPEWTAPRNATANLLRGDKGEVEKFLFYRGLGNFPSPIAMNFLDDGTLEGVLCIGNHGQQDIEHLMVYERGSPAGPKYDSETPSIWYQGPLKAGQELKLKRSTLSPDYGQGMNAMESFHGDLVQAGLTDQEARGLLNTWYDGYFIERGLKAFWILPRAQVDAILPLEITPVPDKLERVIVGRSEILTPGFERELKRVQAADSLARYDGDKYRLAYLDFLYPGKDWGAASSVAAGLPGSAGRTAWRRTGWASPWFTPPHSGPVDLQGRSLPRE
jgi:hypothetical protein